jgi:hypothetical protein
MEKSMKQYIIEDLGEYLKNTLIIDEKEFINSVFDSFRKAHTTKHYVMLVPCDMDDYYSPEEQNSFSKYGYYQMIDENRFNNRFFMPKGNILKACELLENEEMVVDTVHRNASLPTEVKVVSLNGVNTTHFNMDFCQQNGTQTF